MMSGQDLTEGSVLVFSRFVGDRQSPDQPLQHQVLVTSMEKRRQIWLTWKEQGWRWQGCVFTTLITMQLEDHTPLQERFLHTCFLNVFVTRLPLLVETQTGYPTRRRTSSWIALTVCQHVNFGQNGWNKQWTTTSRRFWRTTRTSMSDSSILFHLWIWSIFVILLVDKWIFILMFVRKQTELVIVVCWRSLSMVCLFQWKHFMMATTMQVWSTSIRWMNFCLIWRMTFCCCVKKMPMHIAQFWSRSNPLICRTRRRRPSTLMSRRDRGQLTGRIFKRQTKLKERPVLQTEVYFSRE